MMTSRFSKIQPHDIAVAMGIDDDAALWTLSERIELHYKPETWRQIGTKLRVLDIPRPWLKKRLKKLHNFLQQLGAFHKYSYGGVVGRSCFTHAARHLGRRFIWTRDASDCYPSISPEALKSELRAI